MKKLSKKFKIFACLLLIVGIFSFSFVNIRADSGFDSSYDSGDSDWGVSSSGGSSSDSGDIFFFILCLIIMFIWAKRKANEEDNDNFENNVDVPDELLNKYGISKEEFKREMFNKFVDIQNAWMNFNYESLKDNLTDELYNTYVMQLDTLKLKNQQNIMSDYEFINAAIVGVKEENGLLNVELYLNVSMYDYIVDVNKNLVHGSSVKKINIEYLITFVKTKKVLEEVICPNCGAKIDAKAHGKCEYCNSIVVVSAREFVMSKKTNIGQR